VHSYEAFLTTEGVFRMGWRDLDLLLPSGLERGSVLLIIGKPHSGKTTVTMNMIVNNLKRTDDFRAAIFSPDEPRELVISKLYSIAYGRDAAATEKAIRDGDATTLAEFSEAGRGLLDRVLISDQSLTFNQMLRAMDEAAEYWHAPADVVVMDYLELLPGAAADNTAVAHKAQEAKRWAKTADVPLLLLHQIGRGASERGKPAGIAGGRFGGEAEAVVVMEVYRPKERSGLSAHEAKQVENVIRLSVVKNKKPPFTLRDVEMMMDAASGRIVEPELFDVVHEQVSAELAF
jgi:KaiC/GvpD/RAD55 family RecA-like ATPase